MPSLGQMWALPAASLAIVTITATWFNLVSKEVPEPYLDEFFHIPQAQKYCIGDYTWDPKITTPPGLYLVSQLLKPLLGCSTSSLRVLNAGALCLICPLSYHILRQLRAHHKSAQHDHQNKTSFEEQCSEEDLTSLLDAHSALNITLFSPLFFFSALYYTDILSTVFVLYTYSAFLRKSSTTNSIVREILVAFSGFLALWFRQTNIFWVAVFTAGLAVIDALKVDTIAKPARGDAQSVVRSSWSEGTVYDPSIQDAGLQDYVLFLTSLVIAALRRPSLVIRVALPYVVLLAIFAGFVVWNGSVVLGDKTAHTATLHLPQMLYVWPYIAFFSLPLLVGPLLRPIVPLLPERVQTVCNDSLNTTTELILPTLLVSGLFIVSSLAAVSLNTIVHPYTLADNRHYVFYVFRALRRHPMIKYLAVPVYFACACLVVQALASPTSGEKDSSTKRDGRPTSNQADRQPRQISFIIMWLATTTLSVITAPLVEPRYFIVPWIIWRLHVPYTSASLSASRTSGRSSYDLRLVLETIWLLAINTVLSYSFLYRTFSWPSEPGAKQRFIW